MRLINKVTGIVAGGGIAALVAGLISSGGIGAAFSDSATAKATIDVGTFECNLSQAGNDWVITTHSDKSQTATISFATIQSSAPGSKTAPLTLTNEGSMNARAVWGVPVITGNLPVAFTATPPPASGILAPTNAQVADLGFSWTSLDNSALNKSGTVTYTVQCIEVPAGILTSMPQGGTISNNPDGSVHMDRTNGAPNLKLEGRFGPIPSTAPTITVNPSNGGFWYNIILQNGGRVQGIPSGPNGELRWNAFNNGTPFWAGSGTAGSQTWNDIANHSSELGNVYSVGILFNGDSSNSPATAIDVTCLVYGATQYVGSDTCAQ